MQIRIKKLDKRATIPQYATEGAACFDLAVLEDYRDKDGLLVTTLRTGLAFEIPQDHVMLIFSRSGHGFKNDVRLANCVGVIDSDYRGEVKVKLRCDDVNAEDLIIRAGDRIAQAMVIPVSMVSFVEVDELTETKRGSNGFGSTNEGV